MQITGTHHVALRTANLARLRQFYTETLGLKELGGFPGGKIIFIDTGSTTIEIIEREGVQANETSGAGWVHFAFEVADCDAVYEELKSKGVEFHVLPKNNSDTHPQARLAFFKDPDGNELELFQPLGAQYPQP